MSNQQNVRGLLLHARNEIAHGCFAVLDAAIKGSTQVIFASLQPFVEQYGIHRYELGDNDEDSCCE